VSPPFRRVLVANRGEIALRIVRACHELGSEAVAVYSDADAGALHVRGADRAVRIGPAGPSESYLRIDAIVGAARETEADAIHPGYGFLSEQAAFARACGEAGIVFVGPRPETLEAMGDKLAARRAAAAAGVPIVPGTLEPAPLERADTIDALVAQAEELGWPLLVKAVAGGGGRGMRRVERVADLPEALVSASREAEAAFGLGAVYLERQIDGGRHVEVQLLGDRQGTIVALGERECSIQRRHQKLVEEAPAPGLDGEARSRLHGMGVDVARAVGLENAATAEFLVDREGSPWFLEVNARLQVEHGVTELVTGVDIVHEQLRVAAGEPLGPGVRAAAEVSASPTRHAVEVRLNAEDPARGFAPLPGTILGWRMPEGPGVRIDAGVEEGSRVASEYDSLLAKLLVVAADREAAIGRLARALDETVVLGLQTTVPFHRWLARNRAFRAAELATDFVDRHWDPGPLQAAAAEQAVLAAATVAATVTPTVTATAAPTAPTPATAAPTAATTATLAAPATFPPPGIAVASRDGAAPPAEDAWRTAARREAVERWPG
jgi:acetyl/propionyl-CoA carboxylase alpha subunit